MKRQTIVNLSVAVLFASTSIIGLASEATECTQPCAAAAETITILPARPLALVEPDASNEARVGSGATCGATQPELVKQAEAMNDRIKPVKELVGYVRSPQFEKSCGRRSAGSGQKPDQVPDQSVEQLRRVSAGRNRAERRHLFSRLNKSSKGST